jgi:hypothetical protein
MFHPDPPVEFLKVLEQYNSTCSLRITLVTTLNFTSVPEEVLLDSLRRFYKRVGKEYGIPILPNVGRLLMTLDYLLPGSKVDPKAIAKIAREEIPGIVRGYVTDGPNSVDILAQPLGTVDLESLPKAPHVVQEAHQRTKVITDDDILNLRIALESGSVEDIIKNL